MSVVALNHPFVVRETAHPIPVTESLLGWALMLPIIFFAAHGVFSFQEDGSGSGLSGIVPSRHLGTLGYVAIPGVAYAVVMYVVVANIGRIISVAMEMSMFTLLAFLAICSAFWSQDPSRSFYNGVFYLVATLFAFYLVVSFQTRDIMTLMMMAGTIICLAGLVLVVLFPKFGVDSVGVRTFGAWKGIFIGRTAAAKCLVFLLSPALGTAYGRRSYRWIAYILLVGISILRAEAVTAVLITFLYVLFMVSLYVARRLERRTALILGVAIILICVAAIWASLPFLPHFFRFLGRDTTLTGRTIVWSALIPSVMKRPILGYGFYSFWLGLKGESANVIIGVHWFFGYAHNGLLEIALQLGLVGVVVFLGTLVQGVRNAWFCIRHGHSVGAEWYAGIILLTLLYNVDEATVLLPNELLSILYIVACCGLAMAAKQIRSHELLERRRTASERPAVAVQPLS